MPDANWIPTLWTLIDTCNDGISWDALDDWMPPDVLDVLQSTWLRQTSNSELITCPECGEHEEEPVVFAGRNGDVRMFIACPEFGRVQVYVDDLQLWRFDFQRIAQTVAESLNLTDAVTLAIPDRLWRLGRTQWRQQLREVWLCRQIESLESAQVRRHMQSSLRPILLCCDNQPERVDHQWCPALASLSQLSHWHGGQLAADHRRLMETVVAQDELLNQLRSTQPRLPAPRTIRRHVKAEIESMVSNEMYVAAYRQHQSYRKAAEELSRQTGQKITKDKVARAVAAMEDS